MSAVKHSSRSFFVNSCAPTASAHEKRTQPTARRALLSSALYRTGVAGTEEKKREDPRHGGNRPLFMVGINHYLRFGRFSSRVGPTLATIYYRVHARGCTCVRVFTQWDPCTREKKPVPRRALNACACTCVSACVRASRRLRHRRHYDPTADVHVYGTLTRPGASIFFRAAAARTYVRTYDGPSGSQNVRATRRKLCYVNRNDALVFEKNAPAGTAVFRPCCGQRPSLLSPKNPNL